MDRERMMETVVLGHENKYYVWTKSTMFILEWREHVTCLITVYKGTGSSELIVAQMLRLLIVEPTH